jgi:hypothetical protein
LLKLAQGDAHKEMLPPPAWRQKQKHLLDLGLACRMKFFDNLAINWVGLSWMMAAP